MAKPARFTRIAMAGFVLAAATLGSITAGGQTAYEKRAGVSVRQALAGQSARPEARLARAAMDANLLSRWEYGYDSVVLINPEDFNADGATRELLAKWTCFTLDDTFPIYCGLQSSVFEQWRKTQDQKRRENIVATLSVILAHEQCHPEHCDEKTADARGLQQIERLLATRRIDAPMAAFLKNYVRQSAVAHEKDLDGVKLRMPSAANPAR